MDGAQFCLPSAKDDLRDSLPLVIGPLSYTNVTLQRHSSIYFTAAKVAEKFRIPYVHTPISSLSMTDLDENVVGATMIRWLEIFPFVDMRVLRSLVIRADKCGFSAFVLTLTESMKTVSSIFGDHTNAYPITSSDLETMHAECASMTSSRLQSLVEQRTSVVDTIKFLRQLTEHPIIVNTSIKHQDLIFRALEAGVDAVCVVIDEYMPLPKFIEAIHTIKQQSMSNIPLYAGGSSFTEEEVACLIAHGVERVMIDQPIVWGLMIDGFDGVSNVIDIYKHKLDIHKTENEKYEHNCVGSVVFSYR
uniref:FMN-dependent dehydrogenase domain-containing protein n=1 Tax=Anopheles dirus TaxID=7168 RepID=A0A182NX98_9DIPT